MNTDGMLTCSTTLRFGSITDIQFLNLRIRVFSPAHSVKQRDEILHMESSFQHPNHTYSPLAVCVKCLVGYFGMCATHKQH